MHRYLNCRKSLILVCYKRIMLLSTPQRIRFVPLTTRPDGVTFAKNKSFDKPRSLPRTLPGWPPDRISGWRRRSARPQWTNFLSRTWDRAGFAANARRPARYCESRSARPGRSPCYWSEGVAAAVRSRRRATQSASSFLPSGFCLPSPAPCSFYHRL